MLCLIQLSHGISAMLLELVSCTKIICQNRSTFESFRHLNTRVTSSLEVQVPDLTNRSSLYLECLLPVWYCWFQHLICAYMSFSGTVKLAEFLRNMYKSTLFC